MDKDLIERLEKMKVAPTRDGWEVGDTYVGSFNGDVYAEEVIDEAIAEITRLRNPWVPIGEIPEEWKDGRKVDFFSKYTSVYFPEPDNPAFNYVNIERHPDIKHYGGGTGWLGLPEEFKSYERDSDGETVDKKDADWFRSREVTHAMLPPKGPSQ